MKKILIVNDSPPICKKLSVQLNYIGQFEILIAGDGDKGVAMAKEELPNLIFMDIVMPGLNGFQATKAIKQDAVTSEIPVLGMISRTMQDDVTDQNWLLRQGASGFIYHPFEREEIEQLLTAFKFI